MPQEQRDQLAVSADFEVELHEWSITLERFDYLIPFESALEFQYALNHLYKMCVAKPDARLLHLEKATGHVHRAHLDLVKIMIHAIQRYLGCLRHKALLVAIEGQSELRKQELDALGQTNRTPIFEEYRKLLDGLIFTAVSHVGREEYSRQKPLLPLRRSQPQIAATPGSGSSAGGDFYDVRDLYWQWVQLEATVAAYDGERSYDNVMLIIKAYSRGSLAQDLPDLITILKALLIDKAEANHKLVGEASLLDSHGEPIKKTWETVQDIYVDLKECGRKLGEIDESLRACPPGSDKHRVLLAEYGRLLANKTQLGKTLHSLVERVFPLIFFYFSEQ